MDYEAFLIEVTNMTSDKLKALKDKVARERDHAQAKWSVIYNLFEAREQEAKQQEEESYNQKGE
ncbi:hypothetical protein RLOatenuis_1960 [Rickettsiales bacterium]|nr:hypothetical protein RLOatenuis_1960 [Rickettsiales bacterium]